MTNHRPPRRVARTLLCLAFACAPPAGAQVVCNAPVAPDTIYVGRGGALPGISVIDLNGFGQSTGNPAFDPTFTTFAEGDTDFPNNPNVRLQGSLLLPPLAPGADTRTGGSSGVFTLTRNSALDTLLVSAPSIASAGDMMLGWPLDAAYNNAPAPFGCQAGGGNLCALDGLQVLAVDMGGPHTLRVVPAGAPAFHTVVGGGNPISFAPHPNPPRLLEVPACAVPRIDGQEPTWIGNTLANLLVPGDWAGNPALGVPPSGLLTSEQNQGFLGPSAPQPAIGACGSYVMRQQLGHFLYVADAVAREVVVLNSNTFAVIARIATPDPTELAMSPNLDLLAVTNRAADSVSFIDIDPRSSTFHSVVQTTLVEDAPSGIAWDAGNEDILVCNEGSNSVSILSAATLQVRKRVTRGLDRPFAVATTQRQTNFGYARNVYFAYILDRSGRVCLFESGPGGVNGWGYDEIVGRTPFAFREPRAIQPDPRRLTSGVWIAHQGQLDAAGQPTALTGGALTNLVLDSPALGTIPLTTTDAGVPQMRQLAFRVERSIGTDELTGDPLDIAFENQRNFGALRNEVSPFSAGAPAEMNGKSQVRATPGGIVPSNDPRYVFVPVRDGASGILRGVDVLRLDTGLRVDTNAFRPGVQSIPARGAAVVMDYFRQ